MKEHIPYISSIIVVVGALVFLFHVAYLLLTPPSYWFTYHAIKPAQDVFQIGEPLKFLSFADFHKKTDVRWNDVLRCNFDMDQFGYLFFSEYTSQADSWGPFKSATTPRPWAYNERIPQAPTTCFVDSTITVKLPYGITKQQEIFSPEFRIE